MARFNVGPFHALRAGMVALLLVIAAVILLRPIVSNAAGDGVAPADNVTCLGYERNSVLIGWRDNDNDEASYRVQRSIDSAAFTEIASLPANSMTYKDPNIDVAKDYVYRVEGIHADGSSAGISATCNNRRIFETSNVPNNGFR